MFYSTTFASAFERTAEQNMMKKTFRKTSQNIWKCRIKVFIFASTFAKNLASVTERVL